MPYPERPHFAFPFQLDPTTGSVAVVEQDTVEEIMDCEKVIASYPVGLRHDRPEFGWPWPDMTLVPIDLSGLEQALQQFEPRGTAAASDFLDAIQAAWVNVNTTIGIQSVDMQHTATAAPPYTPPPTGSTIDLIDGGSAGIIFTQTYDGGSASTSSYSTVIEGPAAAYPATEDGGGAFTVFTDAVDGGSAPTTYTTIIDGG
jgi:hypothetical protein